MSEQRVAIVAGARTPFAKAGQAFARLAAGARQARRATLAYEMARRNVRRGLISICAAGAMAGAFLLSRR